MAVAITACKPAHSFYLRTALGWCQVWGWNFHTGPEKAGEKMGGVGENKNKKIDTAPLRALEQQAQ